MKTSFLFLRELKCFRGVESVIFLCPHNHSQSFIPFLTMGNQQTTLSKEEEKEFRRRYNSTLFHFFWKSNWAADSCFSNLSQRRKTPIQQHNKQISVRLWTLLISLFSNSLLTLCFVFFQFLKKNWSKSSWVLKNKQRMAKFHVKISLKLWQITGWWILN